MELTNIFPIHEKRTIPIIDILFDDDTRLRDDLGDLSGLCESITSIGLINPITVYQQEGNKYLLVAGRRRLQSHILLKKEFVDANVYPPGSLSNDDLLIIETAENVHRKQMTFDEESKAVYALHDMLTKRNGGPRIARIANQDGWSINDTAKILGVSMKTVERHIQVARAVEAAPDIVKIAKNQSEVLTLMNRVKKESQVAHRNRTVQFNNNSVKELSRSYITADTLEFLPQLKSEDFDFIEVDPPYGIDLGSIANSRGAAYHEVDNSVYKDFITKVLTECYRILRPDSWIIVWLDMSKYKGIFNILIDIGFTPRKILGHWVKSSGFTNNPRHTLGSSVEYFFIATKGSCELNQPGRNNVFNAGSLRGDRCHITQKPVALYEEIISTLIPKGGHKILIPFAGSGASHIASYRLGHWSMCIDLEPANKEYFINQLSKIEGDMDADDIDKILMKEVIQDDTSV